MYYIRCKDGSRYKVRQAIGLKEALQEISWCRVRGTVGSSTYVTSYVKGLNQPPEVQVVADVVRLNSDNTEQKPYTAVY